MGYRIKSGQTCRRNPESGHECHKNWNDTAQSMEANIIEAGFQESLTKHGLVYRFVIGDADSSVFACLQANVNYPNRLQIQKVDCVNHALEDLIRRFIK
jgi:hypothetical protein